MVYSRPFSKKHPQVYLSLPEKARNVSHEYNEKPHKPFNDQCSHHIETSQQLTGLYMMGK